MTEYDRGYADGMQALNLILKKMEVEELDTRMKRDKARLHELRIEINRIERKQ